MTARATVTEAEYRRAIRAATESGLTLREFEITPGRVRLIFAQDEAVDVERDPADPREPKEWPR